MEPHRALPCADGGYEVATVGSDFDSLFLRRAGGNLLGNPVRETLAPDVISVSCIGGQIHPFPIRGPGAVITLRRCRPDRLPGRTAIEGCQPTGQPRAVVH